MICTSKLSVRLLLIEKFLRRFGEAANLFAKGVIGNLNCDPFLKARDPKSNALSEISTKLANVDCIYASQIVVLTRPKPGAGELDKNSLQDLGRVRS
jgi:hypothetical protein